MDKKTKEMLEFLKLDFLLKKWEEIIELAEKENQSFDKFLKMIIKNEFNSRNEIARSNRVSRAKIPNEFNIETYPFNDQPHLNKKRLLQRYDSLDYITNNRNIIFIGPSGTGKTGLASCILRHAINSGHSGRFIEFNILMEELLSSIADQSSKKVIKRYSNYKCLLIDDLSFLNADNTEIGLFYSLIQKRYKKSCTIITTPYGFSEWNKIFNNKQLSDALIGRLSDNGHIINLKDCKVIRTEPEIN